MICAYRSRILAALSGRPCHKGTIDYGWWWCIPSLGAPASLNFGAFPAHDNTTFLIIKALSLFTGNYALILNLFYLSLTFIWLLGQPIKDTLCGTKVLWRGDYEEIAANRQYFGDFDPFGDFDLLFGAARLNLKIMDVPIR